MKHITWFSIILSFACINIITQTDDYNSLYFQGGCWMEFPQIENMKMVSTENDFTLQFWVSGGEIDIDEAPVLFSIINSNENNKLTLSRDRGQPNSITLIVNNVVYPINIPSMDWSNSNNFYLISLLFSADKNLKVYINDSKIEGVLDNAGSISIDDSHLIVGALANSDYDILENFWYGYIDEIRIWNTWLADSTIEFQSIHPNKLGESYRYTENDIGISTHLDSLVGLWRFNILEPNALMEDESEYNNDGIIYTLPNYTVELSKKGAQ